MSVEVLSGSGGVSVAEVRAFLKDPLVWVRVREPGGRVRSAATGEAVERFLGLDVSHEVLLEVVEGGVSARECGLLASHGGWDVGWVVEQFRVGREQRFVSRLDGVAVAVFGLTCNMSVVLGVAEEICSWESGGWEFKHLVGGSSHLDDVTLLRLVDLGFASLLGDSRVSGDRVLKFLDDNSGVIDNGVSRFNSFGNSFYAAVLKNPNVPSWLLDRAVEFGSPWFFEVEVYENPNLSGEALDYILKHVESRTFRLLIAGHPNVSVRALRKLAKSKYAPLAELAGARLVERDVERVRRSRGFTL